MREDMPRLPGHGLANKRYGRLRQRLGFRSNTLSPGDARDFQHTAQYSARWRMLRHGGMPMHSLVTRLPNIINRLRHQAGDTRDASISIASATEPISE